MPVEIGSLLYADDIILITDLKIEIKKAYTDMGWRNTKKYI